MIKISENIYEYRGVRAEAVARRPTISDCRGCPFNGASCRLPEQSCTPIIGADRVFQKIQGAGNSE